MKPDNDRAATMAMETLIEHGISSAPVSPLPIVKKTPGVLALSYSEMSDGMSMDRTELISMIGMEHHDALTSVHIENGKCFYIVAYNQRLPFTLLQRGLARELGHIVLGHDGSLPADVRNAEAICFAQHLLVPRPLIYAIQQSGIRLTDGVLGNLTACYHHCLSCMRSLPGVRIPADLNRQVRDLFSDYINNLIIFKDKISGSPDSPLADFGPYMDNYEE